jgi:GDP/UDP-N,N'-diacetylbacillosamine 2-epimerase (hydrolysing)
MKVLALTSIRAEYDLLSPLYKMLNNDDEIDFKILVSGAHLSPRYGLTKRHIEDDGLTILAELETLIDGDSSRSKLKTASLFLQNSIDIVAFFSPDVILYAGDREDVVMGGLLGTFLKIPTIHFYGGDHEKGGHEDTVIRHATSKLSTYHFVCHLEHKKRLIALGEISERIFTIGSVALDKFSGFFPKTKEIIAQELKIPPFEACSLVIYHPSPDKNEDDSIVFENILDALASKQIFSFVSYPNTDANNSRIVSVIDKYKNHDNFLFFKNLERDLFLSVFKQSQFLIGNSSAGIYEAASVQIAAINVGRRQTDRMCNNNVVFCSTQFDDISQTIDDVQSDSFLTSIQSQKNIFGEGNSAQKAIKLIKSINLKRLLVKSEDPLDML